VILEKTLCDQGFPLVCWEEKLRTRSWAQKGGEKGWKSAGFWDAWWVPF